MERREVRVLACEHWGHAGGEKKDVPNYVRNSFLFRYYIYLLNGVTYSWSSEHAGTYLKFQTTFDLTAFRLAFPDPHQIDPERCAVFVPSAPGKRMSVFGNFREILTLIDDVVPNQFVYAEIQTFDIAFDNDSDRDMLLTLCDFDRNQSLRQSQFWPQFRQSLLAKTFDLPAHPCFEQDTACELQALDHRMRYLRRMQGEAASK